MAMYQLNFLQLAQKLRQEAGIAGTGPSTTAGQVGELGRVVDWINQAYIDIQEKHDDWNFLRFEFSLPLTIGQAIYPRNINGTNSSDTTSYPLSNIVDMANWREDSMRCYLYGTLTFVSNSGIVTGNTITGQTSGATAYVLGLTGSSFKLLNTTGIFANSETVTNGSGGTAVVSGAVISGYADEQWIKYMEWDTFRDTWLRNANRFAVGRPIYFSIKPDKSLIVYPIPSDNYTVDGEYWKLPIAFVNDTDYPIFPRHHMAIVYNALMRYADYAAEPNLYVYGQNQYFRLIAKLEADRMPPVRIGGSLA
jgi:hypothetical protein